jgi:RNA polymerase sigma-70 factor (ECF subfamily)
MGMASINEPVRCDVARTSRELVESVWHEAAPHLRRVVSALGMALVDADDIMQDVYLTALQRPPDTGEPSELRGWLYTVAVNRCNLEHRRRSRWRRVAERLAGRSRACQSSDGEALACLDEERRLIRSALERMDPAMRSVLVLRYFAEFDSKAIAGILQIPDSTVRSRLRKARMVLAKILEQAGFADD